MKERVAWPRSVLRLCQPLILLGVVVLAACVPVPVPIPTSTPPAGVEFWADRYTLEKGESTWFHWETAGVKEIYFYKEGESWQDHGVARPSGQQQVWPSVSTSYYLRVVFNNGADHTEERRITVEQTQTPPVIAQFDSNPQGEALAGQCVDVYWEVQGKYNNIILTCNGNPLNVASNPGTYHDCDCPKDPGSCEYELNVYGPGGNAGPSAFVVTVRQKPTPPAEITRFETNPQGSVPQGQCVDVSWDAINWDDDLVLSVNGTQLTGGQGTYSYHDCDCPQNIGTCKYQLHVSGPGGEDNAELSVEVVMQTLPGNPAATFCTDNGGQYNSEQSTCTLSDGAVCEAWAYTRGECPAPQ